MFAHLTPRPIRVGLLDFGDGRSFLQAPLEPVNRQFRDQLIQRLRDDGFEVVQILMAAYMSAEMGKTLEFPPKGLEAFVPAVAKGAWNPGH